MVGEETGVSEKITEKLERQKQAYAMFDVVRLNILQIFVEAQTEFGDMVFESINYKVCVDGPSHKGKFIGKMMMIYEWIKPKLSYTKKDYSKLRELDDYLFKIKEYDQMSEKDAMQYFDLIRDFFEFTGLTRYEQEVLEGHETVERDEVEL
jgi:hypothetical protein